MNSVILSFEIYVRGLISKRSMNTLHAKLFPSVLTIFWGGSFAFMTMVMEGKQIVYNFL